MDILKVKWLTDQWRIESGESNCKDISAQNLGQCDSDSNKRSSDITFSSFMESINSKIYTQKPEKDLRLYFKKPKKDQVAQGSSNKQRKNVPIKAVALTDQRHPLIPLNNHQEELMEDLPESRNIVLRNNFTEQAKHPQTENQEKDWEVFMQKTNQLMQKKSEFYQKYQNFKQKSENNAESGPEEREQFFSRRAQTPNLIEYDGMKKKQSSQEPRNQGRLNLLPQTQSSIRQLSQKTQQKNLIRGNEQPLSFFKNVYTKKNDSSSFDLTCSHQPKIKPKIAAQRNVTNLNRTFGLLTHSPLQQQQ